MIRFDFFENNNNKFKRTKIGENHGDATQDITIGSIDWTGSRVRDDSVRLDRRYKETTD